MTRCWSAGELRAYIDRELPADALQAVAAHLEECSECGDLWAELAGRAGRVSALMQALGEPEPVAAPRYMPRRPLVPARRWVWAAAVAAAIALALLALPKHRTQVAVVPPAPVAISPPPPAPEPEPAAIRLTTNRTPRPGLTRGLTRPNHNAARPGVDSVNPFMALDDDPIESGVVWRVELGPREIPAEVIVDPDGRPRAIRLINSKSNY